MMHKKQVSIEAFSHEGRGVGHVGEHTLLATGALPGEKVDVDVIKKRKKVMEGIVTQVHDPSPMRIKPLCQHFLSCGGCSLQHLAPKDQISLKASWFYEQLAHQMPGCAPHRLVPIQKKTEGYRRKARLSVKYVEKKERVVIGFRELRGRWVQDMQMCKVLPEALMDPIRALGPILTQMEARAAIPQLELFVSDHHVACIVRHLMPLSEHDQNLLIDFAKDFSWQVWLQPKGPKTIHSLHPKVPETLSYDLKDFDVTMPFHPGDFIQVHAEVNQAMIHQALDLLDIKMGMPILDLFCGLGNFSLPMARLGAKVSAVEGASEMIQRAEINAKAHGLSIDFSVEDLQQSEWVGAWANEDYQAVLLDPPRSGAWHILPWMVEKKIAKLVYVSCNPATFIRDAKYLTDQGYVLTDVGLMDMFPHTEHVEVMGRFLYQG